MSRNVRLSWGVATSLLAGCVGYGNPSGPGYGGYPAANPPGYPAQAYGEAVRCESEDNHTRHCDMDTRGGVYLSRRLSDTACIQGRNWGYDARGVWVTGGCRGEFTAGAGRGTGYGPGIGGVGQVLRCESQDGRARHCNAAVQRGVQLIRTLSDSACIHGRTWGWDRDGVWVDRGCRAEFSIY
ncbi:MAG: DUF3011 domain-containing protein [Luteimonas sp.]